MTLGVLTQFQVQGAQFSAVNLPPMNLIGAACDPLNSTYVLGTFTNTVSIGGRLFSSLGGTDYVLARYRPNGTVEWAISFGTLQDEEAFSTTLNVTSNAVFVSGQTQGSIHLVDTASNVVNTPYNAGNKADGFLLRFSLSGVAQWQASLMSIGNEQGSGVAFDLAGNVYWVGGFNGCCPSQGSAALRGGDGTSQTLATPSYGTGFLIKLSPAGTPLWVATAYNRDVQFENVAVDSSGAVVVSGYSRSWSSGTATTLIDAGANTRSISNPGYQSSFAAKFNSSGIYQWSVYSTGSPDSAIHLVWQSLTAGTNGDILLGGSYNTVGVSITGADSLAKSLPAPNEQDGFVAALSSSGSVKWLTRIGGSGTDVVNSLSLSSSGGITAAGQMTAGLSLGSTNIASLGGADGFVAMLDQSGNVRKAFALGGPANDQVISVIAGNTGYDMTAGQQGGNFSGLGVSISSAGPFVLTTWGLSLSLIKAVKPSFSNLILSANYQLQVSSDMNNWTNQGSAFTATNTSMVYPQYWDVDNWHQLFFRLQVVP